ncbi:MAG: hypothetical protein P4M07_11410 [Xanthobacteraceae bacterium]|nr:hypothetical protein [Xanthobacteraceae bacterium]
MRIVVASGLALAVAAILSGQVATQAWAGTVLVTAEEAKLPPPKGAFAMAARGITRGPRIELAEIDKGDLRSPVHLQIRFQAFGGATIDLNGLQVTYLKTPNVDLTPRVKPFAQPAGIDIPDAELPPGDHEMRVDVRDSDGRVSTASFVLKVMP